MNGFKKFLSREAVETKELLHGVPALTMTFFVISVVGMNLLANKSIDLKVDWLALDAGMLLSWISFLTMDMLVKRFGPKAAIKLSLMASAINLLLALLFFIAAKIPGFWGESFTDQGDVINGAINVALDNTFAGTWYVILGSTVAFITSSVVNNLTNWGLGKLFKGGGFKTFAARSYLSTMLGQFVDNMIFALIVSHNFFGWTMLQCLTCSITGMLFELLCEVVFSPLGYKMAKRWEKDGVGDKYLDVVSEFEKADAHADGENAESVYADISDESAAGGEATACDDADENVSDGATKDGSETN